MKKILITLLVISMLAVSIGFVIAKKNGECATIKDGTIEYGRVGDSSTEIIPIGYDQWGYNYQAHMFSGLYCNNGRPDPVCTEDDTYLIMKWSDEWLANTDCNGDHKLDRGYSCNPEDASSSACEGAWLTNHQFGSYEEGGETCYWDYFVKIVMVPEDAVAEGGIWYTADHVEIGSVIWGAYARILQVENDPCADLEGVQYNAPAPTGFGFYN